MLLPGRSEHFSVDFLRTSSCGARTVALKTTAAPRDVHRSHNLPLPSVPTRDDRRLRVGVGPIFHRRIGRTRDVPDMQR